MPLRLPQCRTELESNLAELKRRRDLEMLRVFLKHEHCFAPLVNPDQAIISMEDLKKLARAWKLHERRNFWKMNAEKECMVAVLLQHAMESKKFDRIRVESKDGAVDAAVGSAVNEGTTGAEAVGLGSPAPPKERRPTAASPSPRRPTSIHPGAAATAAAEDKTLTHKSPEGQMKIKNFCGLQYFNKEEYDPEVLALQSRFHEAPEPDNTGDSLIKQWRSKNFNISKIEEIVRKVFDTEHDNENESVGTHETGLDAVLRNLHKTLLGKDSDSEKDGQKKQTKKEKKKTHEQRKADEALKKKIAAAEKKEKHRNLAAHLAYYSSSEEVLRMRTADGVSDGEGEDDSESDDDDDESQSKADNSHTSAIVMDRAFADASSKAWVTPYLIEAGNRLPATSSRSTSSANSRKLSTVRSCKTGKTYFKIIFAAASESKSGSRPPAPEY